MGTGDRHRVGQKNKRSHSRCQSEGGKGKADDGRWTTDVCRGLLVRYGMVSVLALQQFPIADSQCDSRTPRWSETQSHRLHVTYCWFVTLARLTG